MNTAVATKILIVEAKTTGNGMEFYGQTESGEVLPGAGAYPDKNNDLCLMRVWPVMGELDSAVEVDVWALDEVETLFPAGVRWFIEVRPAIGMNLATVSQMLINDGCPYDLARIGFCQADVDIAVELASLAPTNADIQDENYLFENFPPYQKADSLNTRRRWVIAQAAVLIAKA
jgi:hypothetical protein